MPSGLNPKTISYPQTWRPGGWITLFVLCSPKVIWAGMIASRHVAPGYVFSGAPPLPGKGGRDLFCLRMPEGRSGYFAVCEP